MKFKAAVASCPGKTLSNNSDNFYFNSKIVTEELSTNQILLSHKKEQKGLQIYAVSDGSGTESYKDSPSLIAMNTLLKYHKKILNDENYDLRVCLRDYIAESNNSVIDKMRATGKKLTATLAVVFVEENAGICCNIGHSRIYKYKNNVLTKLSVDHTQAMRMVNLGLLTEEKASTHPKRGKLLQNLGYMPEGMQLEPHIELFPIEADETYVLCTFGFYDCVKEDRMTEILSLNKSAAETTEMLMSEAVSKGLEDDATVLVVKSYSDDRVTEPVPVITEKPQNHTAPQEKAEHKAPVTEDSIEKTERKVRKESVTLKDVLADMWSNLNKTKNSKSIHWPALTVFVLSVMLVVVMSVFGIELFGRYASDHNLFPRSTANTIAPGVVTLTPKPTGSITPDIEVTPTQGTEPTNEPTDSPTEAPTDTIAPTETPGPTNTPTTEPTTEPTTQPTETPTPGPTDTPVPEPTTGASPEPSTEVTPTETPETTPQPTPAETGENTPPLSEE